MKSLKYGLKELWEAIKWLWKSKFRWLFIAFVFWFYRIEFMSGGGQILQLLAFLFIAYSAYSMRSGIVWYTLNRTSPSVKWVFLFYLFAMISTIWSYWKSYSFFLTFQNIVLIEIALILFLIPKTFKTVEKMFLLFGLGMIIFSFIALRVIWFHSFIAHHLASGTVSAIMLSYCVAELLNKEKNKNRYLLLSTAIIAFISLFASTSSGANASALLGIAVAMFFSKKRVYALILFGAGLFIMLNQDLIEDLLMWLMPGKDMHSISNASGRTVLWNLIHQYIQERPIFGWGYGCVERAITDSGEFTAIDAHNSYLGIIGGLGYFGLGIFILTVINILVYVYKRIKQPGYLGLFCAICCAFTNAFSFGFLSGKTCSITILFLVVIVLSDVYGKVQRQELLKSKL